MHYNEPIIHSGVRGMKWGVRKARKAINKVFAPKVTTRLQTGKDGKQYLVKRLKANDGFVYSKSEVISKKQVSAKQAKAFMDKRKKEKVKDLMKQEQARVAASIASKVVTAYLVLNTGKMIADLKTPSSPQYSTAYAEWLRNG